jgi:hypothetical protein
MLPPFRLPIVLVNSGGRFYYATFLMVGEPVPLLHPWHSGLPSSSVCIQLSLIFQNWFFTAGFINFHIE